MVRHNHQCTAISIHALREERDAPFRKGAFRSEQISIHALREERDPDRPVLLS